MKYFQGPKPNRGADVSAEASAKAEGFAKLEALAKAAAALENHGRINGRSTDGSTTKEPEGMPRTSIRL